MKSNVDITAILSDPEAAGDLIKEALSGHRTFLEEALVSFLHGYFKARSRLIENTTEHKGT